MKKAIAMRCTKEQFEAIKPKLQKYAPTVDLEVGIFQNENFLTNYFWGKKNIIGNISLLSVQNYDRELIEEWNEKVFLEACGIEIEKPIRTNKLTELEKRVEVLEELWLPVHNYYGFYEVSNMGEVRSLSRQVKNSRNPKYTKNVYGKILSKSLNPQGYNKVRLSMYGVKKTHLIHHLVSESFLGHINRTDFICVDHIDEDKTNDKLSNLKIISKQQNTKKSFDYKLSLFINGEYWFHNNGELVLIIELTKLHGGTIKCKHINNANNFAFHHIKTMHRKATESEVFEALKEEAIKRGYKSGVCVKYPWYEEKDEIFIIDINEGNFGNTTKLTQGGFQLKGTQVFFDGKWAEIIPSITKEAAEKELGKKIV